MLVAAYGYTYYVKTYRIPSPPLREAGGKPEMIFVDEKHPLAVRS